MLNDFISFASKFITVEELQCEIVLIIISGVYLFSTWAFDKYDKFIDKQIEKGSE